MAVNVSKMFITAHDPAADVLPFLQIAGGLAALVSLVRYPKLGAVALTCLAVYFVGAVIAHLRVGDGVSDFAIPLGYVVVMAGTAALRGTTIDTDG